MWKRRARSCIEGTGEDAADDAVCFDSGGREDEERCDDVEDVDGNALWPRFGGGEAAIDAYDDEIGEDDRDGRAEDVGSEDAGSEAGLVDRGYGASLDPRTDIKWVLGSCQLRWRDEHNWC